MNFVKYSVRFVVKFSPQRTLRKKITHKAHKDFGFALCAVWFLKRRI